MIPAPPFDCGQCGRRIGRTAAHNILDDDRVICVSCLSDRRAHAAAYPQCPHRWHDLHDHATTVCGTRAGVAALKGLWP